MKYGSSPQNVLDAIKADFKARGLTITSAATIMGMKNRQTLSNIFSRHQNRFMTEKQARRFVEAFGYEIDYLCHGWGELIMDPDEFLDQVFEDITIVPQDIELCGKEMLLDLINEASQIIDATLMPDAKKAWRSLLNKDEDSYRDAVNEITSRLKADNVPVHYSGIFGYMFFQRQNKDKII